MVVGVPISTATSTDADINNIRGIDTTGAIEGSILRYNDTTDNFEISTDSAGITQNQVIALIDSDYVCNSDSHRQDQVAQTPHKFKQSLTQDLVQLRLPQIWQKDQNLYYTAGRVDSDITSAINALSLTTDSVAEGSNLYFTNVRAQTLIDASLSGLSTDSVSEGSTNLYYTAGRVQGVVDNTLALLTTDSVAEGSTNQTMMHR